MPTRLSDLWDYDEPMPDRWMNAIRNLQQLGRTDEAEKLVVEIALLTTQSNVALFVNQQAEARAAKERKAADVRAAAADVLARRLVVATWVLAVSTVGLVIATIVLAVRG